MDQFVSPLECTYFVIPSFASIFIRNLRSVSKERKMLLSNQVLITTFGSRNCLVKIYSVSVKTAVSALAFFGD